MGPRNVSSTRSARSAIQALIFLGNVSLPTAFRPIEEGPMKITWGNHDIPLGQRASIQTNDLRNNKRRLCLGRKKDVQPSNLSPGRKVVVAANALLAAREHPRSVNESDVLSCEAKPATCSYLFKTRYHLLIEEAPTIRQADLNSLPNASCAVRDPIHVRTGSCRMSEGNTKASRRTRGDKQCNLLQNVESAMLEPVKTADGATG